MQTLTLSQIGLGLLIALAIGLICFGIGRTKIGDKAEAAADKATTEVLLDTSAATLHQAIRLRDSKLASAADLQAQAANDTTRIEQTAASIGAMLRPVQAPAPAAPTS